MADAIATATSMLSRATFTTTRTYTRHYSQISSPVGASQTATSTGSYEAFGTEYIGIDVAIIENVAASCENLIKLGSPLQPNPDVSGLGVILAFVISAYVVQCWSVFAYFTGLLPPGLLRHVDLRIMKANSRHVDSEWHEALEKAAIIFSDQQIITGIGILLAGYCNLTSGLSAYHWQIITYLAWMSSNVHLTTLTLLREWLQTNTVLRRWRLSGMAILMVLLTCALVPTRTDAWVYALRNEIWAILQPADYSMNDGRGLGIPTICFWGASDFINLDAPWAFAILISSYVWKMGQLFDTSRFQLKKWLRSVPEWILERAAVNALSEKAARAGCWAIRPRVKYRVVMILYVPTVAFSEFFESFVASLWMLTIGLAWGSVQIFQTRGLAPAHVAAAESSWGFGQILPMLFLLQPAVALFEHFYGSYFFASHRVSRTKKRSASFAKPMLLKIMSNRGLDGNKSNVSAVSMSRASTTTDLEPGSTQDAAPKEMSDILSRLEPKRPSLKANTTDLEQHIEFMYTSRFFVALIWLMNLLVFTCALMVFLVVGGVFPLGGQIWLVGLLTILGSIVFIGLTSCFGSFWSKLYK